MPRPRKYDLADPADAARYVAAMKQNASRRKRSPRRCAVCGTEFPAQARQLYCGPNCNAAAYYRRNHPTVKRSWRGRGAARSSPDPAASDPIPA
jgi:hypothetical protein